MNNTDKKYNEWCKSIAESRNTNELIAHFREHVSEHFKRHNSEGELGLKVWLVAVLNFMHIFEKKFPNIKTDDLLFQLCAYYKEHKDGPTASFDIDEFIKKYSRDLKNHRKYKKYKIK